MYLSSESSEAAAERPVLCFRLSEGGLRERNAVQAQVCLGQ